MDAALSKMLVLGLLQEVVRAPLGPGEGHRRPELGHLGAGAEADIAVLEMVPGEFWFVDSTRTRSALPGAGTACSFHMTLRAGEVV